MESTKFKSQIKKLPAQPGVYLFLGNSGVPLYIGKASNLKSRVSAYLPAGRQARNTDTRIQTMLKNANTLDFKTTGSDIEALILESQLVRRHKPKFNVMLRDDKNYFYVAITDEEFPQFYLTHQLQNKKLKKAVREHIGPFTDGAPLKTTLQFLRRLFPYCTCKQKHYVKCLNAHIGRCLGICCLREQQIPDSQQTTNDKQHYIQNIQAIKQILEGKRNSLIRKLEKEVKVLAAQADVEKAIRLQHKIERIKRVFENAVIIRHQTSKSGVLEQLQRVLNLPAVPHRIEGYDISNIQGQHPTGSMVVFTAGRADRNEYRKFNIKGRYGRSVFPCNCKTSATNLQKFPQQSNSSASKISSDSHSKFCNFVTKETAHIAPGGGSNDTAMLKEMLARRLNHPEWPLPDLIVVDGGIPQLNAIHSALKAKSSQLKALPIIALTKNDRHRGDHIYVTNRQLTTNNLQQIPLRQLPEAVKNLILHVDAEAHRFAISHYRILHRRSLK